MKKKRQNLTRLTSKKKIAHDLMLGVHNGPVMVNHVSK